METQIKWLDIQSGKGTCKRLNDFQFHTYRQLEKKNGNYIQFSNFLTELYKDGFLKVGKMGDRLVFNFNIENGMPIKMYGNNKNARVSSANLVQLIFDTLGYDKSQTVNIYNLIDIGDNSFILTRTK